MDLSQDDINYALGFIRSLGEIGVTPHVSKSVVYKYVTLETAKTILNNSSMRFSSPDAFNDPFEMSLDQFDFSLKMKHLKKEMEHFVVNQNPGLSKKLIEKIARTISRNEFLDSHIRTCKKQRQGARILCGSRKNNVALMWSHYAERHSGVCIGYKIPTYQQDPEMFTLNVKYAEAITPMQYFSDDERERTMSLINWIFTKSHIWRYEKEVRTYIPEDALIQKGNQQFVDIPFSNDQFCELYFGVSVTDHQIDDLRKLIQSKNYNIQKMGKMEINKGTFDLKCSFF